MSRQVDTFMEEALKIVSAAQASSVFRFIVIAAAALGAAALGDPALADDAPAPTGPLADIGQELAAKGITFNASYFGEFASNPSGGAEQGSDYADQAAAGADIDLHKLIDLEGGYFHIEFTNRDGRDLVNDTVNNSVAVQQIYGGGQTYMLTTLTYEQKLFGDMLDIQAGRTELDQVVLQDPIYCHFQSNAFCGQPDIMGKIINASFYPVPVWGADAVVRPMKDIYFRGGAYDSNAAESEPGHHGFDFAFDHAQGALFPFEGGYETTFADDTYPRRYDAGVVFDRTPYTYPVYQSATKTMGSAGADDREMIYFQGKQMVLRPDPNAQRGLTLFGAAVFGPDAHQVADYNLTAGAVYQGPLKSRPDDSVGIAVGDTHYRSNFLNQLQAFQIGALGGSQRPAANLVMTEIDYDAFVTKWFDVMPNLQYIVNPDGLGALPYPRSNLRDAFVVGIQFNIDIGQLAGLPATP